MIPAAFDYHRPQGIEDAIAILQKHGDDARVIAGGHSLIPMMKLRMAEVPNLVDLQDIESLKGITIQNGRVNIGAMVTQHELITNKGWLPPHQSCARQRCKLPTRRYGTWALLAAMLPMAIPAMTCRA